MGRLYWGERTGWTDAAWLALIDRPAYHTWVAYRGAPGSTPGSPSETSVGYFELEEQADRSVQIVCLGLLPRYIGRGWGRPLVTAAAERAWELGAVRVWLDTATDAGY